MERLKQVLPVCNEARMAAMARYRAQTTDGERALVGSRATEAKKEDWQRTESEWEQVLQGVT